MNALSFDTHALVKELKAAGFTDAQAEALTTAVRSAQDGADLVTKADLQIGLADAKADIIKWMFGTIGFQTLIILGAVIALARLLQP